MAMSEIKIDTKVFFEVTVLMYRAEDVREPVPCSLNHADISSFYERDKSTTIVICADEEYVVDMPYAQFKEGMKKAICSLR